MEYLLYLLQKTFLSTGYTEGMLLCLRSPILSPEGNVVLSPIDVVFDSSWSGRHAVPLLNTITTLWTFNTTWSILGNLPLINTSY